MLFNSTIFICLFFPICILGWYLLQKIKSQAPAMVFLVGMSLWFYGYYNVLYLAVLIGSVTINYFLCFFMHKAGEKWVDRFLLSLGLIFNIGLLFYFKYFNFFIDNCNFFFHTDIAVEKIALPLGISFFTFQQISYCIEKYKGKYGDYSFLEYVCFVTFFPQLIAGPIVLADEFVPQLRARRYRKIDGSMFYDGFALFILGLGKKVLLADVLAIIVNDEYANLYYLDFVSAWVTIICYMLELYFDFSGYCDMARGIGKMFGFTLPENFNSPLMSTSVREFWKRWHMTLSRFLMTYIYIPLGGNRKGKTRKCINLLIVFFVSGVWHGANWTFIVWGCLHGLAIVFETLFPKARFKNDKINRIVTGLYVTFTFSIFRADSLGDASIICKKLFAGGFHNTFTGLCNRLVIPETYAIRKMIELMGWPLLNPLFVCCTIALLLVSVILISGKKAEEYIALTKGSRRQAFTLGSIFVWSFISLSHVSTFLYFNF